jgi:hypothetical protein
MLSDPPVHTPTSPFSSINHEIPRRYGVATHSSVSTQRTAYSDHIHFYHLLLLLDLLSPSRFPCLTIHITLLYYPSMSLPTSSLLYLSPRMIRSAASPFAAVVRFSHPSLVIRRSSSMRTPPTGINRSSTDLLMYFECTGDGRKTVSRASRLK